MPQLDAATLAYKSGWALVRRVPYPIARWAANLGADLACDFGKSAPQLRKNLARVVGPENVTRELVRASMRSYARYWLEAFRLPSMVEDEQLVDELAASLHNSEVLTQSEPTPRIFVLPHSGNWDMAALYFTSTFGALTTVAERLKPEAVFEMFVEYRQSLGLTVIPHEGGGSPFAALKEAIARGDSVCLLGERDLKRSGVEVEFFGEKTRMPAGPARLAIETGAPLHVVHCWFEEDGWGMSISDPVDVSDIASTTQLVATAMEANIARHPEDWHMLQPLWLKDLDQERYQRGLRDS